nr:MAG TPA: hypothetical protein [Caudoviricetes sp.]
MSQKQYLQLHSLVEFLLTELYFEMIIGFRLDYVHQYHY